jgi:hypothetical protein
VDTTWRQHWVAALDELELEVEAAEAMLADDHRAREVPVSDAWAPPVGLGPLPLDLLPRADGILARQLGAAEAIALALAGTRRQVALSVRIETGEPAPRPAYVDCAM